MNNGKFDGLRSVGSTNGHLLPVSHSEIETIPTSSRQGKKVISGHFSTELHRAISLVALEQSVSVQAAVGEALDLLLRHYGKHPFGER